MTPLIVDLFAGGGGQVLRLWCRWWGHRWTRDDRGAPVADFLCCVRCGRWER